MSQALNKIGKLIRDASDEAPAGTEPSYKKEASPHTYEDPNVVFNEHLKQTSPEESTDQLEELMLKEAISQREAPQEDPAAILEKDAAKSAMDGFDSQKVIEAVNSAKDVDGKIQAYLSASNAEAIKTPKDKGN